MALDVYIFCISNRAKVDFVVAYCCSEVAVQLVTVVLHNNWLLSVAKSGAQASQVVHRRKQRCCIST